MIPAINSIRPLKDFTSYKTVSTILTSSDTVDGCTTYLYKDFVPNCVTWGMNQRFILYNNKGITINQTISNTFIYSV